MIDWNALYNVSLGLYVLGAMDGNRPVGSIVDAVMIAASNPCAPAVSCHNRSYTKSCIEKNHKFSLSVLAADTQPELVAIFGFSSGKTVDKWQNISFEKLNNLPVLKDCLAQITAKVLHQYQLNSNTIFVAEITSAKRIKNGDPYLYAYYRNSCKDQVLKCCQPWLKEKENV